MRLYRAPSSPSTAVMIRDQAALSPSGPNTIEDPSTEKASTWLIAPPSRRNSSCPPEVLSTSSAKTTCSARPQATVRASMARRFVDRA